MPSNVKVCIERDWSVRERNRNVRVALE